MTRTLTHSNLYTVIEMFSLAHVVTHDTKLYLLRWYLFIFAHIHKLMQTSGNSG